MGPGTDMYFVLNVLFNHPRDLDKNKDVDIILKLAKVRLCCTVFGDYELTIMYRKRGSVINPRQHITSSTNQLCPHSSRLYRMVHSLTSILLPVCGDR
jgi:hypothetical protein